MCVAEGSLRSLQRHRPFGVSVVTRRVPASFFRDAENCRRKVDRDLKVSAHTVRVAHTCCVRQVLVLNSCVMGKYEPVSAAEAYARAGESRPRCECHGELMGWGTTSNTRKGGWWRCVVRGRELHREHTLRHPERIKKIRAESWARNKENGLTRKRMKDRLRYQESLSKGMCGRCCKEVLFTKTLCYLCSLKVSEDSLIRRMLR